MSLPDYYKKTLNKLQTKNAAQELLKHLAVDVGLLGLVYLCINEGGLMSYAVAQLIWPVVFFRFFSLMHDASHMSVSRSIRINNFIGYISGAFCFLPFYPWKKLHLEHHYWTGNIEKDPVMKIVKEFGLYSKSKKRLMDIAWKGWIPLLAFMQHLVFWSRSVGFLVQARKKKKMWECLFSYLIPLLIYTALYSVGILSLRNMLPGFVLYLAMVEIINFPHHLQLPQATGSVRFPVWEQYKVSRSCHYSRWFSRWILNNFNYHTEHHLFPQVPWYQLDQIYKELEISLGSKYNKSFKNEWIIKNRSGEIDSVIIYNEAPYKEKISA